MIGGSSRSATPSRSTSSTRVDRSQANRELAELFQEEKNQASPFHPTNKGLSALISAANSALNSQFRDQVDRYSIDKTSLGAINASLQTLEHSLHIENNEKLPAVTRAKVAKQDLSQVDKKYQGVKTSLKSKEIEMKQLQETIQKLSTELEELKKEANDNVILGYNIMRRAVAWKFTGCNMIKLDQQATKEAQKGKQPASTQADEPTKAEAGSQDAPQSGNELVISLSEMGPSAEVQGAGKL
ncbi:hypothetical protein FNV43_RR00447 [Rhamnella rubrinervis]|uniref:Uncharacterized protein n=1 Tax=Rhamnella rubrinervis TaxID=2594499 RepID=A0A8K0HQD8_9ROSA|nr:hypothetical protein FNV43_RR00447 [Rhamnella rubrinervis]